MQIERIKAALRQVIAILAAGYILVFFSELTFWARPRPDDSLGNWLATWVAYSLVAVIFLWAVSWFKVRSLWSLILAGALVGWLAEGVIVQTTYEMLPLSISFTGLAWHDLISVVTGWYFLRIILRTAPFWKATLAFALAGFFWAFWGITWWLEPDGGVAPLPDFSAYVVIASILLALAFWVFEKTWHVDRRPSKTTMLVVAGLFVIQFLLVAVPAYPFAPLVLLPLLGLTFWGLHSNRKREALQIIPEIAQPPTPLHNYLAVLALPLAAIVFYALALALDLRIHTNWIIYLIITPAGAVLWVLALLKTLKPPEPPSP